jgi:hypothetical protein
MKLARQLIAIHSIPLYIVLIASVISLAFMSALALGFQLWQVAILIIIAWLPIWIAKTLSIYRQYHWLAVFFMLLVAQSVHFTEHIAQMIEIHILGIDPSKAHGIIGMLDLEWTHFIFDGIWVPICVFTLSFVFRKTNPWLWPLLIIVIWHGIEHCYIIIFYLRTGIVGSPGLLAQGGAIAGGLPLIRADLHFLYNLAEETLIIVAYLHQIKQLSGPKELIIPRRFVPASIFSEQERTKIQELQ